MVKFKYLDYQWEIAHDNLAPNSSASAIISCSDGNRVSKCFASIIYNKKNINKTDKEYSNPLSISFREIGYSNKQKKMSDNEVLISRFVDKTLRPTLRDLDFDIAIEILCLQNSNVCNLKFLSSCVASIMFKKIFPIYSCPTFFTKGNSSCFLSFDEDLNLLTIDLESKDISADSFLEEVQKSSAEAESFQKILKKIKSEEKIKKNKEKDLKIKENHIKNWQELLEKNSFNSVRTKVSEFLCINKRRVDESRKPLEIRPIKITSHLNNNGNVIFSRGSTVVLCGWSPDQRNDFSVSYEFPNFSTGTISGRSSSYSRREIGHSNIIYKALNYSASQAKGSVNAMVLSADGSTSMASVCAGSIVLKNNNITEELTSGISMGLFLSDKDSLVICDLSAEEDIFSECDFKITCTEKFITSITMDVKKCLPIKNLRNVLECGWGKCQEIISLMKNSEDDIKIERESMKIPKDRVGLFIGSGGVTIQSISKYSNCNIKISKEGEISIFGNDLTMAKKFINFYGSSKLEDNMEVAFLVRKVISDKLVLSTNGELHLSKKVPENTVFVSGVISNWEKKKIKVSSFK